MDSIVLNGFAVKISCDNNNAEKVMMNGTEYFALDHGSEYKIQMSNHTKTKCDAEVYVDGDKIGLWRINSYSTISIERPTNIKRKFIFYDEKSGDAQSAGINSGKSTNGLVKVIFKPELIQKYRHCNDYYLDHSSPQLLSFSNSVNESYGSGATALGDNSRQTFGNTSQIVNVDHSRVTTIQTRLIVRNGSNQKPISINKAMNATPYPQRVDDMNIDASFFNSPKGMFRTYAF